VAGFNSTCDFRCWRGSLQLPPCCACPTPLTNETTIDCFCLVCFTSSLYPQRTLYVLIYWVHIHHLAATTVTSIVKSELWSLNFTSRTSYPELYDRVVLPITPRIVTVEVRNPQANTMPAQKIALSAGRSTPRHHELPRRRLRLQPEHYIRRDTGELVPLVPADELPLEFHGLSRSLSPVESSRMVFLGQKGPSTGYYRMKQPK
jgi:hypothetical protein